MQSYNINKKEDISNIPDEHIREFALDAYDGYQELFKLLTNTLAPFGVQIPVKSSVFTPDGKGYSLEIDEIVIKNK